MELPWRLFGGIVLFWLLVGLVPSIIWRDLHEASDFANTFGFVNALFAALAFGGVIWAIRLQTRELELQRLEIEETRDELRRSADAQQQSQQMHFFTALLTARNSVASGYASCAASETGPLQLNRLAHRKHLAQLEWLLQLIDRHEGNPFVLPSEELIVAHQVALQLSRAHPILASALTNRATNFIRLILQELSQSIRESRRLLQGTSAEAQLPGAIDTFLSVVETATTADSFDEVAQISQTAFDPLSLQVSQLVGYPLPTLNGTPTKMAASSETVAANS